MKSEKGITLTSLVIYIMVATIVIATMAIVSSFFFSNINLVRDQDKYAVEFNKFNMFFVNDVKNNKTAQVQTHKITFEDGTIYARINIYSRHVSSGKYQYCKKSNSCFYEYWKKRKFSKRN